VSNPWDILILGCGQLGGNLKTALEAEKIHVLGVRRTKVPNDPTMISLDLDVVDSWDHLAHIPLASHAVIIAIVTPDARTEAAYRARYVGISERLRQFASLPGRRHPVIWVSSTVVFGQHQLGLLDESDPAEPDHWRGRLVREAELNIEQIKAPKTVIRFAGLYTVKSLIRLKDAELRKQLNPETVSNRMHREDAVSWLRALARDHLEGEKVPQLIHGVDEGSSHYQQIFDVLDGLMSEIQPATTGRIMQSRYRDRMPTLRYPTCKSVISSP
jgi:nucleoside-diphosphate-sugar epimerase